MVGVDAIDVAQATIAEGVGWQIHLSISDGYRSFREAATKSPGSMVAIVAGGKVQLAFRLGVPALDSAIGPELTEEQARGGAAALSAARALPVEFVAPPLPALKGPRVNMDVWTAALGVRVCGKWLDNAPKTSAERGLHSHGDGLVYVHPTESNEAEADATLGLFLAGVGWSVTPKQMRVWDGVQHIIGDSCRNGHRASLRWAVDGIEQHGDPSTWCVRNGQVIVLAFDTPESPLRIPTQATAALQLPMLHPN